MVTAAGPWIILFAPLAAFIGIVLFGRKSKPVSAGLAIAGMVVSLGFTLTFFFHSLHAHEAIETAVSWVELPGLTLEFGLLINPAAILMALVVTGVGLMIFLYSTGYMAEDSSYPRYFAYLSLFAFSMLGIVLANNFVTLFMFWELVGASSYLLIGYWYEKPSAAAAGKKAFLVNRIADFGFLIGILMVWNLSGMGGEARTLNFLQLEERLPEILHSGAVAPGLLAAIVLLVFCGVLGKSAQFPLHVWLPDAMEGPTPVSALIHAATMVAAGVYLIGRVFFLFWASPEALAVIAAIGGFTALFAASLALVENDIKRVLAFSTLSQLGYMVMALGLGGYVAGTYHLTTHAFFKALLFLGAGSVIHALHTNDIWQMGGLAKKMPATTFTFLAATLALAGIFPLSGFWSKDEILAVAFERNKLLWAVGTLSAAMTAFYMGRVFCVAFLGKPRSHHAEHAHESPPSMTVPLWILTVPTLIGGFIGIPQYLHHATEAGLHVEFNLFVALISTLAAVGGLGLAYAVYARGARPGLKGQELLSRLAVPLSRKFWVDEMYSWINQNVQQRFADLLALFERFIIIQLCVNGVAKVTGLAGSLLRTAQTGKVQTYAAMLLAGLGFLLYLNLK
ncbi:MAG: NADH-quinone oxidoreductase subunit L [Candidatus Omnitrophota bacterium]|nr:NADH-quinone oxidoreductase subunit L [Candidatus Omnitrophota bacterium]